MFFKLKYKSKEVEAKEDGVKVLKETNKYLSELIAKVDPVGSCYMEGSMEVAQIVSLRSGSTDFSVTQINQELAQNLGLIEFSNLKAVVKGLQNKKFGIMGLIFGLGTDIGTIGQGGGFSKKPSTTDVDITSTEGSGNGKRKVFEGLNVKVYGFPTIGFEQFRVQSEVQSNLDARINNVLKFAVGKVEEQSKIDLMNILHLIHLQ